MKLIRKEKLVAQIAKKAGISSSKATIAYETILRESPAFRQQSIKTVTAKKEVAVKVPGKTQVKKVNVTKQKAVKTGAAIEKIKIVEVKVPVPVEKIKEVIKEVKVIKEVPVEVIKEITLVREVEKVVTKEVKVADPKALNALQKKLDASVAREKELKKKLSAKPKTIIKEVPVEIIREIEVVKQIDFSSLQKMMKGMKTVEVSKKVVGETRTKKEGKIVSRQEVKAGSRTKKVSKTVKSKSSGKPDDLTKIEGIGPKISSLLHAGGIKTFEALSKTAVSRLQEILNAAGPRYQMHKPGSWPKQSGLAAAGKWDELEKLQDELDGGK
jgi:predicted flap endonuclease-1-like 5' DNA nuclease